MGTPDKKQLTPKQEQFCQEYLKDLNATKAAKRAGYSDGTAYSQGSRLLKDVEVKARIDEMMSERQNNTKITAEKILKDIEAIRDRCMQGVPVLDDEGNETGVWKFESFAALKACELLGKHLGMFKERVEHSGKVDLSSISDAELDQKIKMLMKERK